MVIDARGRISASRLKEDFSKMTDCLRFVTVSGANAQKKI